MSTFNQVTESCFTDCVNDFTTRRLTKQEVSNIILSVCFAILKLAMSILIILSKTMFIISVMYFSMNK